MIKTRPGKSDYNIPGWEMETQPGLEELWPKLYGSPSEIKRNLDQFVPLCDALPGNSVNLFSSPGRTELGGNHTDHNNGKVLCAAVRQDIKAAAVPRDDRLVLLKSAGYPGIFEVDGTDLDLQGEEKGTTNALIRGVLKGFVDAGAHSGGFEARITSDVPVGSGLSSSAAFEVLIGTILNDFYNDNALPPEQIARIGRFAENVYFGKPCGLMDQMASAVGGIMLIDFADPNKPHIEQIDYDFNKTDYILTIINTGDSHDDLTPAYAAIPAEMKAVAATQGGEVLRAINEEHIHSNFTSIRKMCGDRAILRALHFYNENRRVEAMGAQLAGNNFEGFLELVNTSGISSQTLLQNTIPPGSDGREQAVNLIIGLSHLLFARKGRGACRIHGGGFTGTVQSYSHKNDFGEYRQLIDSTIGPGTLVPLQTRPVGAVKVLTLKRRPGAK